MLLAADAAAGTRVIAATRGTTMESKTVIHEVLGDTEEKKCGFCRRFVPVWAGDLRHGKFQCLRCEEIRQDVENDRASERKNQEEE